MADLVQSWAVVSFRLAPILRAATPDLATSRTKNSLALTAKDSGPRHPLFPAHRIVHGAQFR